MFVRCKKKSDRLSFSVVKSVRQGSQVRQETVITLGTVSEPVFRQAGRYESGDQDGQVLENSSLFVDFWFEVRNKVNAWDRAKWQMVMKGICRYLPRQAQYWNFDYIVHRMSIKQGLRKKRESRTGRPIG